MISVIVPVYNAEKYLEECLDSLENQTISDFEIILVDDGSTDSSALICDRFSTQSKRNVLVFHKKNEGQLIAHRKGISLARGNFLVFLDSDDCLREDALALISSVVSKYNPDIVCFDYCRDASVSYDSADSKIPDLSSGYYEGNSYEDIKKATCSGVFNNLATKAIRKSILDLDTDYVQWKGLMHGEDFMQVIPAVDKATTAYYLNEVLYFYRENSSSSTRSFKESQIDDLDRVFFRLFSFAKQWGSQYVEIAKSAVCKHMVWIMFNLVQCKELSKKDKKEITEKLAFVIKRYCGESWKRVANKLRLEMNILVRCICQGHYLSAIVAAKVIVTLTKTFD